MQSPAPEVAAVKSKTSTSKDKIKFLLLEGIHPSAVAVIQAAGYTQIECLAGALSGEELERRLAGVHFLGIAVFNAPFSNTRSVAEMVLAEGMGMKVIFFDVVSKLPLGNASQVPCLDDLLRQADVVSLHVPETAATRWMMGPAQIEAMKQGGVLINASRGTVVDIEALADALRSRRLAGAAIDVYPDEPRSNDEHFESPLRGFDNVILTPHIGGFTVEAQENIGIEVAEKLVKYSDNGTSTSSVNFPEVALPAHPGKHRLLQVHRKAGSCSERARTMNAWSVGKVDNGACRVLNATGGHVGNLKWIRGVWKFKAIGYDASGEIIPGGGPLTDQHNTVFASIDAWQINNSAPIAPSHGRHPAAVRGPAVPGGRGSSRSPAVSGPRR